MNHTQNILKLAEHLTTIKEVQSQMVEWANQGISKIEVKKRIENLAVGIYAENNKEFQEEIFQSI